MAGLFTKSKLCEELTSTTALKLKETRPMLTVAATDNVKSPTTDAHRAKDFLDPTEIKIFLEAAKAGRNGTRDHLLFLMMYRHGLRCSEAIDLRIEELRMSALTELPCGSGGSRDRTQGCIPSKETSLGLSADTSLLEMTGCLGCSYLNAKEGWAGLLSTILWRGPLRQQGFRMFIPIVLGIVVDMR
jgi:hypothetical protein